MLAVCDKMCNAIDSICNDTSEHKYATASVAVNTTLFANTGSALGVVADELDEILAVCHETCNAIDSMIEAIDDDDGAEHEFANAIMCVQLNVVFNCDTHAGVESKQLFDIPNSEALQETECMKLDAVADNSAIASNGPTQHISLESEQSITPTIKVAMVLCQELPKASDLAPGPLILGTPRLITAQSCEQYRHEQDEELLLKPRSPCDASSAINRSQLLQYACLQVTDTYHTFNVSNEASASQNHIGDSKEAAQQLFSEAELDLGDLLDPGTITLQVLDASQQTSDVHLVIAITHCSTAFDVLCNDDLGTVELDPGPQGACRSNTATSNEIDFLVSTELDPGDIDSLSIVRDSDVASTITTSTRDSRATQCFVGPDLDQEKQFQSKSIRDGHVAHCHYTTSPDTVKLCDTKFHPYLEILVPHEIISAEAIPPQRAADPEQHPKVKLDASELDPGPCRFNAQVGTLNYPREPIIISSRLKFHLASCSAEPNHAYQGRGTVDTAELIKRDRFC